MSHTNTSLDAAATERKARLAKLASLKRKRPDPEPTSQSDTGADVTIEEDPSLQQTHKYVSGRNYDISTQGPKLGFEQQPQSQHETVEDKAKILTTSVAEQAAQDELDAQRGIDLFKLQPKKPNWDLKRDLAERTKVLDVRTQNAIARLVRERIQKAKEDAQKKQPIPNIEGAEEVGLEGTVLVEAVHLREKEDEEDRRKEASSNEEGIP